MYASFSTVAAAALFSLASAAPASLKKRASGKAGLSWAAQEGSAAPVALFFGSGSALTWWFDWTKNYGSDFFRGDISLATPVSINAKFIPMEYNAQSLSQPFDLQAGYTDLMGYNEPDRPENAIDPGTAAANWKDIVTTYKAANPSLKLYSPGMASDITWLESFANLICPGYPGSWETCEYAWDYTVVHMYNSDLGVFQQNVNEFHGQFGRDVIVAEFACHNFDSSVEPSQQDVNAFMTEMSITQASAMEWLDAQEWVYLYAWFGAARAESNMHQVADTNRLMDVNGQITPLGQQYMRGGT
ncbi:MAG: hypothetical protein TREMPRED_005205 [Tremellales sp. Tagirdzhanova-0007]|nr:MAG: hypothetical protein TREMPRED_005205 [Tremellales sp. Tagirdzhanova-0007]